MPTVNVVVLGGTITMAPSPDGGITPSLSGEDLLAQIPGLKDVAKVVVTTPFLKPGASLELEEIARLVDDIEGEGASAHDGTVFVQGTDTIDETSFLIDLLYSGEAPVVVTGAMRGAAALSADGSANLFAAISTAASESSRNMGALVVLNDEIHSARTVEKMHKGLTSSFQSPNGGPLGYVMENRVRFVRRPYTKPAQALKPSRYASVAIVKMGLGEGTAILDALPGLGYEGAVIEAMGVGHVPANVVAAIETLSKAMPVVLASRVIGGPSFSSTYGFPGSEIDLLRRGLLTCEWLSPHKARLLLSATLGCGYDRPQIQEAFKVYGQP